jgi:hypothetical protein
MSNQLVQAQIGMPPLNDVSTTQKWPLGYIAKFADNAVAVPNGGEATYLKAGGANVVAGSMCELDPVTGGAALAPATAGVGPMCVSINIVPQNSFSWFYVMGTVPVKAPNAMTPGADLFMLAATAGSVDDAVVAGEQILNAEVNTSTGTPSTGLALININRPFHQGQIT